LLAFKNSEFKPIKVELSIKNFGHFHAPDTPLIFFGFNLKQKKAGQTRSMSCLDDCLIGRYQIRINWH
jgi:hypothetical protein